MGNVCAITGVREGPIQNTFQDPYERAVSALLGHESYQSDNNKSQAASGREASDVPSHDVSLPGESVQLAVRDPPPWRNAPHRGSETVVRAGTPSQSVSRPPAEPSVPVTSPSPAPQSSPVSFRPCVAAQLAASVQMRPIGAGSFLYSITIRDLGKPCSLRGRPTGVEGVYSSARMVRLSPVPLSADLLAALTTGRPANLTMRLPAEVVLVTSSGCHGGALPSHLFTALRLRIGAAWIAVVDVPGPEPQDTGIAFPCGLAMSGYYASKVAA